MAKYYDKDIAKGKSEPWRPTDSYKEELWRQSTRTMQKAQVDDTVIRNPKLTKVAGILSKVADTKVRKFGFGKKGKTKR